MVLVHATKVDARAIPDALIETIRLSPHEAIAFRNEALNLVHLWDYDFSALILPRLAPSGNSLPDDVLLDYPAKDGGGLAEFAGSLEEWVVYYANEIYDGALLWF